MKIYSLFFGLTSAILFAGIHSATLIVKNSCSYTIWPATISAGGAAQLSNTGFELASQTSNSLDVPDSWTGRIWARTQCKLDSSGRFTCATADCGTNMVACNGTGGAPPASLVEFSLASNGGQDFYDVSLVDGFNLPVSITPLGGYGVACATIGCAGNVNEVCPSELALVDPEGSIIGCKSACVVYNQPRYCCTGEYNSPDTCKPTNYSMIFRNKCPQAYTIPYEGSSKSSAVSCFGGPNYLITFCPSLAGSFLTCSLYLSKI